MTVVVRNPEDATEVVREGFAHALTHRRDFRSEGPLEAWIWKIVLRKALDRLASTHPGASLDELPEIGLPDAERDSALAAALRELPPRKRLIVDLHYF